MTAAETAAVVETTRHVLRTAEPVDVVATLRDLGWFAMRAEDRAAVEGAFFEVQGKCLATSGVLDAVVLEEWAVGSSGPAVLHPAIGRGRATDGVVVRPGEFDTVLTPTGRLVAVSDPDVRPVDGIDPWLGWRTVRVPVGPDGARPQDPDTATAVARRALAHELIGVTRHLTALAVGHVTTRHQFGRAIGSFQAVQHRLADVRVALEVAEQAVQAAWEEPGELTAAMAKILAGHAARTAAKQAQQVMGGMGFTWESPLHRGVRRALALDAFYGSAAALTSDLGAGAIDLSRVAAL